MNNKWVRAAIPALLIHCSVGTVYCWSTFKEAIANKIGMSPFSVGWAFSLAIFFLGMSAAFGGKIVERDIHVSSLVACICFSTGMVGTGLVIKFLTGVPALIGIYVFYGAIMGIGLGIGYLTPVKTLMLWFKDNKGLATGISIMGFGLAKAIATPIMDLIQNKLGIVSMFVILGLAYMVLMLLGHFLLKKPDGWVEEPATNQGSALSMFKNKQFIGIWLMFYLNIHCGLMIITYEKQLLSSAFATSLKLATTHCCSMWDRRWHVVITSSSTDRRSSTCRTSGCRRRHRRLCIWRQDATRSRPSSQETTAPCFTMTV